MQQTNKEVIRNLSARGFQNLIEAVEQVQEEMLEIHCGDLLERRRTCDDILNKAGRAYM